MSHYKTRLSLFDQPQVKYTIPLTINNNNVRDLQYALELSSAAPATYCHNLHYWHKHRPVPGLTAVRLSGMSLRTLGSRLTWWRILLTWIQSSATRITTFMSVGKLSSAMLVLLAEVVGSRIYNSGTVKPILQNQSFT